MFTRNIQPVLISIGLIAIASVSYAVGTSFVFFSSSAFLQQAYLLSLIGLMPLGFIVLPHIISKKYDLYSTEAEVNFNWRSYLILAVTIFLINFFLIRSEEYFHQMVISMSEEFLFRFVIYKILRKRMSYWSAIFIGSLLFGFVLHLNYPILDNLLIRAPLGLLFSLLATRLGLQYAVAGHWIYNLLASRFIF